MNTPRTDGWRRTVVALLLTLCAASHASAQQPQAGAPEREQLFLADVPSPEAQRGRQLLEQGDAEGAINVLRPATERDKPDGEAWHLLGLAYARQGKRQDALQSFERAVAVRLDRLAFGTVPNAERFVRLTAEQRAATKERALERHREALESVEAYLQQNPDGADFWRAQAETIKAHAEQVAALDDDYRDVRPDSKGTRLVINAKPDPGYTEEARRHGTGGRVRLRAIFGADGKVTHPLAIRPLPHGLTEKAFEAARRISFQPATVDGRPVSQFIILEYGFEIHHRGIRPPTMPRPRPRFP